MGQAKRSDLRLEELRKALPELLAGIMRETTAAEPRLGPLRFTNAGKDAEHSTHMMMDHAASNIGYVFGRYQKGSFEAQRTRLYGHYASLRWLLAGRLSACLISGCFGL